jgi:hypothetical protein
MDCRVKRAGDNSRTCGFIGVGFSFCTINFLYRLVVDA